MKDTSYIDELSRCVRCGTCKAFCPTYDEDATEAMSARGRLALLQGLASGQLKPSVLINQRIFGCTLCGKCMTICPLDVNVREVIYHGRTVLNKTDRKRKALRFMTQLFLKNPKLGFKVLSATQHVAFPYFSRSGIIPRHTQLPEYTLRDNLKVFSLSSKKGRVAVFAGCMVNFMYPHLGESLIHVLHKLRYEVVLLAGDLCCGAPLRSLGLHEQALEIANRNTTLFNRLHVEAVLSPCPTCTLTLKHEYADLIDQPVENAMDISSFLVHQLDAYNFSHLASTIQNAVYHDPCHLKYGLNVELEPRQIIRMLGINLVNVQDVKCCGFAGLFSLSFRELSECMLNACIDVYGPTGAEMIITSCPGCIFQLTKNPQGRPVIHLIELVEEALSAEA